MALRGDRLKVLRQRARFSQEDLAARIGSSQRMIGRYESNEADPTSDVVMRLAKEFGVTTDYLLGLSDDPLGQIDESDLTPAERRLITAFRQGDITDALTLVAEIAKTRSKGGR